MKITKKQAYKLRRRCEELALEAQGCVRAARKMEKRLRLALHARAILQNQVRLLERDADEILTLEELRGMVGEPVWVEDLLIANCSAYHFVQLLGGEPVLTEARFYPLGSKAVPYYGTSEQSGYEQTWVAYRRRPREEMV